MIFGLLPCIVSAGHVTVTGRTAIRTRSDVAGLAWHGSSSGSAIRRKPISGMACNWSEEEVFVIPGTVSDDEEKLIDKLLDELEEAVGGAVPQIGAVKKAIEKLGPGKDVVDVVVVYKCIDNAGKVHRKRARLDGQTEAVFWAAKMNLASGSAKADRDRERQKAINNHRPRVSCCPKAGPAVPPVQPKPDPPVETPPGPVPEPPSDSGCKIPPPCDACKATHQKLMNACAGLKEWDDQIANLKTQLKPSLDRRDIFSRQIKRLRDEKAAAADIAAKEKELQTAEAQVKAFEADIEKAKSERLKVETEISKLTTEIKNCEKQSCGKTATGNNPVSGLDPCLVGDWVSQDSTDRQGAVGKGNIKMKIAQDAKVTIVYDGMNPAVLKNPVTGNTDQVQTWSGSAMGKVTAKNGVVVLQSVESSAIKITATQYGRTETRPTSSLGIVIPPAPYLVKYECAGNTLKVSVNFFGEIVEGFIFVKK